MFNFRFARSLLVGMVMILMGVMVACQPVADLPSASPTDAEPTGLVVATHSSFAVSEGVIAQFEADHNATVQFLDLGDAGETLNKVILSKDSPLADVFFGVDNTFLSRAMAADIFVPYAAPGLATIPADLQLDAESRLLPVDFGYVNINVDRTGTPRRTAPARNAGRSGQIRPTPGCWWSKIRPPHRPAWPSS